jgi:prepilin-type processing-associated H-X9-DG protein
MVYDSVWLDTAPGARGAIDNAPSDAEHEMDSYNANWVTNSLKYLCIDRHGGGINAAFVDMDVRYLGVKELWLLKWNKNWVKCEPPNAWPSWTDRFKDYDE